MEQIKYKVFEMSKETVQEKIGEIFKLIGLHIWNMFVGQYIFLAKFVHIMLRDDNDTQK